MTTRFALILHALALQMFALEASDVEVKEMISRLEPDSIFYKEKLIPNAEKVAPLAHLLYANYIKGHEG